MPRYLCRRFNSAAQAFSTNEHSVDTRMSSRTNPKSDSDSEVHSSPGAALSQYAPNAVLLVVPDTEIRNLLAFGLKRQGYEVIEATTGDEANDLALQWRPAAILLDMDVSNGEGLAVLTRLRDWSRIPILALAGRQGGPGVIEALDHGASDFILRPFNIEEVSARLRAARRYAPPPPPDVFQSGSLQVDLTSRTVKVAEKKIRLTGTEYSLLQLFVRHAGRVLTHAEILSAVWGTQAMDKLNHLRVYLRALRKKLENPSEQSLFQTEPAVGYRLVIREP